MKSFSLPASFYEEIAAMHDKLAVKMFRAVYDYMYSDGEDKSIDRIITLDGADFIIRFKAWAQKKFDQAERRRQRAAERRLKAANKSNITVESKSLTVKGLSESREQAIDANSTRDRTSISYIPSSDEEWEYGVDGCTVEQMRGLVFKLTGDSRIFSLRFDKVALIYLLHYASSLAASTIAAYQDHLYKYYLARD